MTTATQTALPGLAPPPKPAPAIEPWLAPLQSPEQGSPQSFTDPTHDAPDAPPSWLSGPVKTIWLGDGTALMHDFPQHVLKSSGHPVWFDDHNTPSRAVIRRAENRFQAYQRLEDEWLSVGYFITRSDIRPFLSGDEVEVMSEFGEDTEAEPLTYTTIPVDA